MGSWSWLRILGVAAAAVLLLAWLTRSPAPTVRTAKVQRGPLRVEVLTNGKVEPIDEAEVRARLEGRIVAMPQPGTQVPMGAEIVRIDDGPVASALAAAESERLVSVESLRAAEHALELARERLVTDRGLFQEGAVTRERYQESEAAFRDAEARVAFLQREVPLKLDSLDLKIEELRAQKEAAVVHAPFTGTVYRTEVEKGQLVRVGDPILWIADLERLRVRANVDQVDLGRVREGQLVHVTSNAYPERLWTGRISEVIPHVVVKESRSVSESLARLDLPIDGLVPGMTVDVEIVVSEVGDALQIPAEALFDADGQPFVYRVEGRHVRVLPVTLGLASVSAVEVSGGVEPDDLVVLGPVDGLRDGARVEARRPEERAS